MPLEVHMAKQRKRRSFSPEYKAEVVQYILDSGKTVGQVCREMDLTETAVRRWVEQARIDRDDSPDGPITTSEREELRRLRRENKQLRMEREILKKATAFFAKENS
jgi:transposase